jgi:hypothetical protein
MRDDDLAAVVDGLGVVAGSDPAPLLVAAEATTTAALVGPGSNAEGRPRRTRSAS